MHNTPNKSFQPTANAAAEFRRYVLIMVIFWWIVFCIWAVLIPAALLNGRAFLSGLPNNFYLNMP
jgi:hypothetical protein